VTDCDLKTRRTRSGRVTTQRVVLPAADVSEHEQDNDFDSEYEQVQSDSESECSSSSDGEQLGRNVSNTFAAVNNEYDHIPSVRMTKSGYVNKSRDVGKVFRWTIVKCQRCLVLVQFPHSRCRHQMVTRHSCKDGFSAYVELQALLACITLISGSGWYHSISQSIGDFLKWPQ